MRRPFDNTGGNAYRALCNFVQIERRKKWRLELRYRARGVQSNRRTRRG